MRRELRPAELDSGAAAVRGALKRAAREQTTTSWARLEQLLVDVVEDDAVVLQSPHPPGTDLLTGQVLEDELLLLVDVVNRTGRCGRPQRGQEDRRHRRGPGWR
ncbi:hypothetical protein AB0451_37840 [Streptomyces sp. NPDC052000]|uniref:hypothetical protein n=1 Tax=Streptomyces sp. NPDC052000 TaxID=3155676 RepID=UPI00344BB2CB